jgi:hypothetical protein
MLQNWLPTKTKERTLWEEYIHYVQLCNNGKLFLDFLATFTSCVSMHYAVSF